MNIPKFIKTTLLSYNESLTNNTELKIFTSDFNIKIKGEIDMLSVEYDNTNDINEFISRKFISDMAIAFFGLDVYETNLRNKVNKPINNFQLESYLSDGTIIYASFIHVNNNHEIELDKCDINLMTNDYDIIKKII